MESIKKISELAPPELAAVERLFGRNLGSSADGILILRTLDRTDSSSVGETEVPIWCNVLEGLSDTDLADFHADVEAPVRLAHPSV